MFIDTHCHIDTYEEQAKECFEALLARLDAGELQKPEAFVHVACNPADFEYARELSERYPFVYATYGIHPEYVMTETAEDESHLLQYLKHPKCVACGEFGLDYHYDREHRDQQMELFSRHMDIALESGKPLVLHLREADEDTIAVLNSKDIREKNIHVHCFTGSPEFVEQLLELGFSKKANLFVGFTGILTFKNAQNVRDAASKVPLDQLLLETDAPYLAPVPHRGKPCHSGYIPYIAEALAQIKNITVEELYGICRENTRHCYGI
jgi:TatD DNase family protein